MNRFRKGVAYFLSLLLLASLLGAAISTSANETVGKPKKVEAYLAQSKLYDHFIVYTTDQAKKSSGDTDTSGSVSLSDAAVQTAAQQAFPPKLIQQSINTFIDSNYAWLEGKTATPAFKIDLSSQKQTFAEKVGQYVTTYTAGLPVCANDQVAAQQTGDPLAATCRPSQVTPEAAGAQVTERLSTSGDFLSNPVITASSVNPKGNTQSKPYYVKLSHFPKVYRAETKAPYILGILSLLWAVCIIFLLERRKGFRRVGIVLAIAGTALVLLKFFADFTFKKAEDKLFNTANVGPLQQSLTDFAHRIESAMVRIDLWFGIAYLLLALIILGVLWRTRQKSGSKPKELPDLPDEDDSKKSPLIISRKRLGRRTPSDSIMPLGAQPPSEEPGAPAESAVESAPQPPKPKKKRRLIQ